MLESVGGAFPALGKAAEGGRAPELEQDELHSAFYRPWENGPSLIKGPQKAYLSLIPYSTLERLFFLQFLLCCLSYPFFNKIYKAH